MKIWVAASLLTLLASSTSALAQVADSPDSPELAACKATALVALKERSPSVRDIVFDMESLSVSKANTSVEDVPVRTIIMAEAYLERKETGKSQHFLCLIGDKGKVLLTFFTTK